MSFTSNSSNIVVSAKLTTYGRKQLLIGNANNLITKFSLGDSDANYLTPIPLTFGEVPGVSGDLGFNNSSSNSIFDNVDVRNKIFVDSIGNLYKNVELNSNTVSSTIKFGTAVTVSGITQDFKKINIDATTSSPNLFKSFYLPILTTEKFNFTNITNTSSGYSDTTFGAMRVDDILVINISGSTYGELVSGKDFKTVITTTGGTYNLYSTFQKTLTPNTVQDANYKETSPKANTIGNNIVFLFSDQIQKPNNDSTKSWSTGYGLIKPFSQKNKELFNYIDNISLSYNKDVMVGYVVLDKGFIVITNPAIVSAFNNTSKVVTTFNTLFTDVAQDISCVVNRGEFSMSTNSTYSDGDVIRVSEVGLYDANNSLVALGKINKQIELGANQFMALSIRITV